ncbi:hypothetical protein PG997_008620 [Apiospora hydei]|uniref:Uncharacterized protein n=1 Tax=Apiospora hydei TaxID=1337664 RepID=A0ABR1WBK4_9PEZI
MEDHCGHVKRSHYALNEALGMGTKGLELDHKDSAKPQPQEVERPTTGDSTKSEASGEMRLAWMFVQGWRQRLQRGEQLVEEHRSDATAGDDSRSVRGRRRSSASINSRLSYVTGSIESAELKVKQDTRVRKDSVHSGSDL